MKKNILKLLKKCGAVLKGHFQLSSGLHSDTYIQCAKLFQYPRISEKVAKALRISRKKKIEVVVSPAVGGIIWGYELARLLKARAIFCEREGGKMVLRRGFSLNEGERVLIAEDVITTGGTINELISLVKKYNPKNIYVVCIVNRSGLKRIGGIKIMSLVDLKIKNYKPKNCPLCKVGIGLVSPGSRRLA